MSSKSSSSDELPSNVDVLWSNWGVLPVPFDRTVGALLDDILLGMGDRASFFLTEAPRTMTGLAVTVRATIDEGPSLAASALASCEGVIAGTAGASLGVIKAGIIIEPFGVFSPEAL